MPDIRIAIQIVKGTESFIIYVENPMEETLQTGRLELGPESLKYLNTTRKWTMFFAILGFIFLGMMIIAGVAAGAFLSIFDQSPTGAEIPKWLFAAIMAAFAVLYFFPIFYLFRFSTFMRNAVQNYSSDDLRKAFKNLKAYFVYLGVLVIIVLALYFVAIVVAGASMALLKP
jgi:hypothetical protein